MLDKTPSLVYTSNIGNINPIRYRGYYYDIESSLYYLNTRYYDPAIGRFINADEITILDETQSQIHGLNLYMYCGNNPVGMIDPSGRFFFTALLIGLGIGAVIGGTMSGISAYNDGQRGWGLFGAIAGGAVIGGAMGAALVIGGAAGLSAAIAPLGMTIAGFGLSTGAAVATTLGIGVGAGLVGYSLENGLRSDREWTVGGFMLAGISGGFKAASTFGIGYVGGKIGGFDKMILKSMLKGSETLSKSISYGIAKSILAASMPGTGRKLMSIASFYIGETIAKMLFISSSASGVRWIIDKIFGT